MTRSILLALFMFTISQMASAAIFKSYNDKKNCTEYSVVNKLRTESGEYVYERELRAGEEILTDKTIYGLSLKNMTINFDQRTAEFDLIKNVTLGFNRPLFALGTRVTIDSTHAEFQKITNLLNRKVILIQSICLDEKQSIISLIHD